MKPIFSDLKKLESDSKNFPTIANARFKLSDICDSNWVKIYKKENQ